MQDLEIRKRSKIVWYCTSEFVSSTQRRSRPETAQINEAKGLEGGCTARLFVSVVRVTVAEVSTMGQELASGRRWRELDA
eukprot:scaffold1469_cov56-Cyclotella_meneghiniana.AAC.1